MKTIVILGIMVILALLGYLKNHFHGKLLQKSIEDESSARQKLLAAREAFQKAFFNREKANDMDEEFQICLMNVISAEVEVYEKESETGKAFRMPGPKDDALSITKRYLSEIKDTSFLEKIENRLFALEVGVHEKV